MNVTYLLAWTRVTGIFLSAKGEGKKEEEEEDEVLGLGLSTNNLLILHLLVDVKAQISLFLVACLARLH